MKRIKIAVLGYSDVGKTSLCHYLKYQTFNSSITNTIGAAFFEVKLDNNITLELWDTAGSERFHSLIPVYLKKIDICFFVWSQDVPGSWEKLEDYLKMLYTYNDYIGGILIIEAKKDLSPTPSPEKNVEDFLTKCNKICVGLPPKKIRVSSKTGENIHLIENFIKNIVSLDKTTLIYDNEDDDIEFVTPPKSCCSK